MNVYVYQNNTEKILKNAYIGEYHELQYDFTTGTHGWTASSSAGLQNSNGIYTNGNLTDVFWTSPSEIFNYGVPKKITINYNKTGSDNGTGFRTTSSDTWYFLPQGSAYASQNNKLSYSNNGTITQNTINNPTGNCTWEIDINTSTTNWTLTHKITGVSNITDTSGAFKTLWNSGIFELRTINRRDNNMGIYVKSIAFEY